MFEPPEVARGGPMRKKAFHKLDGNKQVNTLKARDVERVNALCTARQNKLFLSVIIKKVFFVEKKIFSQSTCSALPVNHTLA